MTHVPDYREVMLAAAAGAQRIYELALAAAEAAGVDADTARGHLTDLAWNGYEWPESAPAPTPPRAPHLRLVAR